MLSFSGKKQKFVSERFTRGTDQRGLRSVYPHATWATHFSLRCQRRRSQSEARSGEGEGRASAPGSSLLQNRKQLLLPGRRDWAGQGAAADGGGGAGSTAGWRGKASVLILPIGARACEPVGVAAA